MRFRNTPVLVIYGVIVSATMCTARADLITNGSFETPIVTSGLEYQDINPGSEPPGFGWTVVSGNVDVVIRGPNFALSAFDGLQFLDLDGFVAGAIEQSFATTPGDAYFLSFAYSNNWGGTIPAQATVRAFDSGTSADLIAPILLKHGDATIANPDWKQSETIRFVAQGANTTLSFTSGDPRGSDGGIFLDAVSVDVAAIPEPSSLALVLIGPGIRHRSTCIAPPKIAIENAVTGSGTALERHRPPHRHHVLPGTEQLKRSDSCRGREYLVRCLTPTSCRSALAG